MPFDLAAYPEAFAPPFRCTPHSAWHSHLPLAPILIRLLRPRTFVELGTHAGDSYLAFCHAVRTLSTGTRCTAIDTWKGDLHTREYGPEILQALRAVHDPNFGAFSRLLPSTFDDAAPSFADAGIDLLHIDGAHAYEAVRHDYHTWLPKLSSRGVILFHDTTEREQDYGVWKLWEEVAPGRPHANLPHGHGLGILAVGPDTASPFLEFLDALNTRPSLVKIFEELGSRVLLINTFALAMRHLYQSQSLVNEWRQRTGQPILTPSNRPDAALSDPEAFGAGVVRDVRQLTADALNLVAEVMAQRQKRKANDLMDAVPFLK